MNKDVLSEAGSLNQAVTALQMHFGMPASQIMEIAEAFRRAMVEGLYEKNGPLKMLPSYLGIPTGNETGTYLAVDFGGTNVRVLLVELSDGRISILNPQPVTSLLRDPGGKYDYTTEETSAEELFDFIADLVAKLVTPDESYILGHTFSYPSWQKDVNTASLICWTKEVKTSGVVGKDINLLLTQALARKGLGGVKPRVILNDTVGTLLVAAYEDGDADVGSICGTGHNTCYFELKPGQGTKPMIINMESGSFNLKLPITKYDEQLDQTSDKPGDHLLEKMVSGQYIGEIMRLILCDLAGKGLIFKGAEPSGFPFSTKVVSAEHLSVLISADLWAMDNMLINEWKISRPADDEIVALRSIASMLVVRAARLVASTYLGVLRHIDSKLERKHTIAIDGSLYEKMPGFSENIKAAIDEVLKDRSKLVTLRLTKDGSGIGAAIAAATLGF